MILIATKENHAITLTMLTDSDDVRLGDDNAMDERNNTVN